jgi:putative tricarboxylic transport membrane protein
MKGKRLLTQTRLEALVILGAVAVYIWEGLNIPQYYSLPGVPGPTVFPIILGTAMAGAALWLMIVPGRQAEEKRRLSAADRRRGLQARWRFYLMWGLLIAYVFLLPLLGFLICSAVLLSAFFFLLGERRWYLGISIACVFSLGIYFLFTKALQINLPMGILEVVLRP